MGNNKNWIVTIPTKNGLVCLNGYASESARLYVDTLVDQARRCKADPRDALINTDDYPKLMKRSMVEFACGYIHAIAECYMVKPEQVFDAAIEPELAAKIAELRVAWGLVKAPKALKLARKAG